MKHSPNRAKERAVYGYEYTGRGARRKVTKVHLMANGRPLCGREGEYILTEFGMGKRRCAGCLKMERQQKEELKKEERRKRLEYEIEYSKTMF